MEMTFAMIKPNAVKSGLIGRIIDRYIAAGLSVCAVKMHQMTSADARGFYAEHGTRYPPLRFCPFHDRKRRAQLRQS